MEGKTPTGKSPSSGRKFFLYHSMSSEDNEEQLSAKECNPNQSNPLKPEQQGALKGGPNPSGSNSTLKTSENLLKVSSPPATASTGSLAEALRLSALNEKEASSCIEELDDNLSKPLAGSGDSFGDDDDQFDTDQRRPSRIAIDPFHVPKILRRNQSYEALQRQGWNANEARVLVLYTGGTIGMIKNEQGVLAPAPRQLEQHIRSYPHLHDAKYAETFYAAASKKDKDDPTQILTPLVLPETREPKRVVYTVFEYEPILDSSNMTLDDYVRIAQDIKTAYHLFDGFVVLHGTDTLAYTASALSFMLENLGKTVILTGSQIPLFETLSDGRDNFIGALVMAGNFNIPEVTVFFNHKLLRGNRTTKVSTSRFDAFNTHNMRPLATVGIQIHVHYKDIFRPSSIERFKIHPKMNSNVGLLRLFPSISLATVRSFFQPPIEGVVLQSYGAGNIPDNRADIMNEISLAIKERNVVIVNITQCHQGSVDAHYATGKILLDAGVIPGADMTPEAALSKLSYVLSKDEWDLEAKRQKLMENLRGEMTVYERMDPKNDMDLINALSKALKFSSSKEIAQMKAFLFPCLLCTAAKSGDNQRIEELIKSGADVSATDYDGRSALHVACCEGNVDTVKFLLENGANVHIRDRNDRTPLQNAIDFGQVECCKLLIQCGADVCGRVSKSIFIIGDDLCRAATMGRLNSLRAFRESGVKLTVANQMGSTAVHASALSRQLDTLEYILSSEVEAFECTDAFGRTAEDLAEELGYTDVLDVFEKVRASLSRRAVGAK